MVMIVVAKKRINTKAKGNLRQRMLIARLEAEGWLVGKVEQGGKFTKVKDLFGLFDLAALKPRNLQLIQVTCNTPHTHKHYQAFVDKYLIKAYQWVYMDRKGWKQFIYKPHKNKETHIYY